MDGCFYPISEGMKERMRKNEQRAQIRYRLACACLCGLSLLFGAGAFAALLVWPWALLAWPAFVWALYRFYLRERWYRFPLEHFRLPKVRKVTEPQLISSEIVSVQPMTMPTSDVFHFEYRGPER